MSFQEQIEFNLISSLASVGDWFLLLIAQIQIYKIESGKDVVVQE
jgi:hypothetical protein